MNEGLSVFGLISGNLVYEFRVVQHSDMEFSQSAINCSQAIYHLPLGVILYNHGNGLQSS